MRRSTNIINTHEIASGGPPLVMKVADRVLVMDYGQYLFEGAPAEAQVDPGVVAAYLGA